MPNIIEILVTGKNLTKPAFEEAAREGRAIGQEAGRQFTTGLGEQVAQELPAAVDAPLSKTKEPARRSGQDAGTAFTRAMGAQIDHDQLVGLQGIAEGRGKLAGTGFSVKFSESAKSGIESGALFAALGPAGVEALAKVEGERSGFNFTDAMGGRVRQDLPDKVQKPIEDSATKAGQGAASALGPLLVGAFAAAATAGPGLILAGTASAVLGAGALIAQGNAQVSASYQHLGQDAANAITQATAPLVPDLLGAVRVLDDGLGQAGGELKAAFAAAAPYARDMAGGILSLVDNALPGFVSLLRAGAPYAQQLAADFGKLGAGAAQFFQGLSGGAGGGVAGFSALIDLASHLLGDVGQIAGALSGGLGPALHDVDMVAVPVAAALTAVVDALPPGAIRAAADATAALFLAFKIGTLTGIVAEGTTFVAFLRGAGVAATTTAVEMDALSLSERAVAVSTTAATGALGAMSAATAAAAGPWGLLAAAIYVGTENIRVAGVRLGDLNPEKAAQNINDLTKTIVTDFGKGGRAIDGAAESVVQYASFIARGVQSANALSSALSTAATSAATQAQSTAAGTLAALGFRDGQDQVTIALDQTITAYEQVSSQASAYKSALDALYGKYQSYSDAQATFTTDLDNAAKQLTHGRDAFDLNTAAGSANERLLSQLATANENRAEALLKETGNQNQANKALQDGARQLDATAKAAGFTQGQIDALNLALYGTKNIGSIEVPVGADTSGAYNGVKSLIHWIDSQSASLPVGYGGPAHPGFAHGGIVGMAAAGGPRSGLTAVGEHGIELLDLPPGTRVHSNPDSMRMLAQGGGGWDGTVRVEWIGAGAGDDFMTWLRNRIRVTAGTGPDSVQRALGNRF